MDLRREQYFGYRGEGVGRKLLFFERSPPRGGTLRDSGWESLAPAAGYIWGGTLRETGASAGGHIWGWGFAV